jgi:hypothetical protein
MPSLNFKPQFADDIASGQKRQTIRVRGKRAWKTGDVLHLFSGMRTTACKRIGTATLLSVQTITIDAGMRKVFLELPVSNGSRYMAALTDDEIMELAQADGFATPDDFFFFF